MPKAHLLPFLPLLLACLAVQPARADKADRQQPLNFAADAARVDEAQRLNILTGNVDITKGTMVIQADRVEVRQVPDGNQVATATGGKGGRSYFKQKREGLNELIEGEAEKIVYDGRDDTVLFTGRAVMRRIIAGALSDEVNGQQIRYDNKSATYQVMGGQAPAGQAAGRVRGVIAPRNAAVPAPASAANPATVQMPAQEGGR